MFSTNIPTSLYERLDRLSKATGQPKSVHLEAALRAYLRWKRSAGK
jgi:predicted DNA-binding protein